MIPVEYDVDLRKLKAVIEEVVTQETLVLQGEPRDIVLDAFEDSSMSILIHVWVKTDDYWQAKWNVMEKIKYAFDDAQIVIPFNQMDVHIVEPS